LEAVEKRRRRMIDEQLRAHGIADGRVLAAMAAVPREEFVPREVREYAYADRALGIAAGQTISQPLVVAAMTEAAAAQPEDTVLEVGTGSGYQAAVLSLLCRRVISIEREPELAELASEALARLGFHNVEVLLGDGALGHPPEAPYPAIVVTAAAPAVPPALVDQLADRGRLVIPVGVAGGDQELLLLSRRGAAIASEVLFPVRFVPLRS
jgi:protein-L-isoaspartate(D-aspartate) O-methyltransferase